MAALVSFCHQMTLTCSYFSSPEPSARPFDSELIVLLDRPLALTIFSRYAK